MSFMMDISPLALPAPLVHGQALENWANASVENVSGLGVISMTMNSTCLFLPVCCLSALKVLNLSCSLPIGRRCRQWSQINLLTIFRMYMGVLWSQSFIRVWRETVGMRRTPGNTCKLLLPRVRQDRDSERGGSSFKKTFQLLKSWSWSHK